MDTQSGYIIVIASPLLQIVCEHASFWCYMYIAGRAEKNCLRPVWPLQKAEMGTEKFYEWVCWPSCAHELDMREYGDHLVLMSWICVSMVTIWCSWVGYAWVWWPSCAHELDMREYGDHLVLMSWICVSMVTIWCSWVGYNNNNNKKKKKKKMKKHDIKELQKNQAILATAHKPAGKANVKLQNILHGRSNITCWTDWKYRTAATRHMIET